MSRLNQVNPAEATGAAKAVLDTVKRKMGMVPNVLKVLANQPAALEGYLSFSAALEKGSFDPATREAIALATAGANGCDYCVSAHTAVSKMLKVDKAEIEKRIAGHSTDPKLDAALTFARTVVAKRGFVGNDDLTAVRAAGLGDGAIVEIVANVVGTIYTNYVNHVAETEIDFPKVSSVAYRVAEPV